MAEKLRPFSVTFGIRDRRLNLNDVGILLSLVFDQKAQFFLSLSKVGEVDELIKAKYKCVHLLHRPNFPGSNPGRVIWYWIHFCAFCILKRRFSNVSNAFIFFLVAYLKDVTVILLQICSCFIPFYQLGCLQDAGSLQIYCRIYRSLRFYSICPLCCLYSITTICYYCWHDALTLKRGIAFIHKYNNYTQC
jgi:hypothetical protein